MSQRFNKLLTLKPFLVGMVHLRPLPGTPGFNVKAMPFEKVCEIAVNEAKILSSHGIDSLLIENMHDLPYVRASIIGPEIVASMSKISTLIRQEVPKTPVGIQILAGANQQALAVAAASDLDFVRVEGFVFSHIADEGFIDACAGELLRYRKAINAEHIAIFADIKKKHSSHSITDDLSHSEVAKAAKFFKVDGLIVTGSSTGHAPTPNLLKDASSAVGSLPVLVGSGVNSKNVSSFIKAGAAGFIVGSDLKKDGHWENELEPYRIRAMVEKIRTIRTMF